MKKQTAGIIKTALMLPLALILAGCGGGSKTVDLNNYVEVEFEGYDSLGTASYSIDIDELLDDHMVEFGLEEASKSEVSKVLSDLKKKIDGELDKENELSNGETVTFKWDNIDTKTFQEKYSVKLNFSDIAVEVSGLETPKEFNPFDYISVSYDGLAPYGKININKNGELPVSGINFRADKTDHLRNGDTITIAAEASDDFRNYCFIRGYVPTEEEHEYTVSGLSGYAETLDEIPVEAIDKLNDHAQDSFRAYVAQKWADAETLLGINYIGNYFLTPKDDSISASTYNYLYFIYKVTAKNTDSEESFNYYYYSYYTNIIMLDDGTCSFDMNTLSVPSYSSEGFKTGKYHYPGHQDIDSLFNKQVTSKIDKYSYVSTVNE